MQRSAADRRVPPVYALLPVSVVIPARAWKSKPEPLMTLGTLKAVSLRLKASTPLMITLPVPKLPAQPPC